MTVRYSRRALAQLDDIIEYYAARSPKVASKFSERVETLTALLGRRPEIGRPTDIANLRVFRAAPYPYLIFYSIRSKGRGITILRIRHTARKENWREGR
jgi:plasmid stabilization system protein ParE